MKTYTPPKHKTPNYKLRPSHDLDGKIIAWVWVTQPLRATRKDLAP